MKKTIILILLMCTTTYAEYGEPLRTEVLDRYENGWRWKAIDVDRDAILPIATPKDVSDFLQKRGPMDSIPFWELEKHRRALQAGVKFIFEGLGTITTATDAKDPICSVS